MKPTSQDLEKARNLTAEACPRRYCYFWRSLAYDWEIPASAGCTFLDDPIPDYKYAHVPCCRCDSTSAVDHFEPLEPTAEEDGVDYTKWLKVKEENKQRLIEEEKQETDINK